MPRGGTDFLDRKTAVWPMFWTVIGLAGAVLADAVVAPALLLGWTGFCFLPALVILTGMFRGSWRGLWAGWLGGLLLAALFAEPLGFAMLRLGLAGFAGGFFSRVAAFGVIWLDALVLLLLLFLEDLGSGLLAWGVLRAPVDLNMLGVLLTTLFCAILLRGWFRWRPRGGLMLETPSS